MIPAAEKVSRDSESADTVRLYWRQTYDKFMLSKDTTGRGSWHLKVICYQVWPFLFNREMAFFERYFVRRMLKRHSPDLRDKRVLDIGCGTARWSEFFAAYGANVMGTDLFADVLSDNRNRFPSISFSSMTATRLALRENSIDFVNAAIVLMYVPRLQKGLALQEIARVLRAQGIALILEPVVAKGYRETETTSKVSPEEWKKLLTQNGFKILDEKSLHAYPLAHLYIMVNHWIGIVIKRIKRLGKQFETKAELVSSSTPRTSENRKKEGLFAKRHAIYHILDQNMLRLIACLSFPLEFVWLQLGLPASHRMFLVQKSASCRHLKDC